VIVVYEKHTGNIAYTIEDAMAYDRDRLAEGEDMIVTEDGSVRANTHKVVERRLVRKSNEEIEAELRGRSEQERLAVEKLQAHEVDLLERLEEAERRLAQLEGKGSI